MCDKSLIRKYKTSDSSNKRQKTNQSGENSKGIVLFTEELNRNFCRSGKIQKIELKNFMCHENLTVNFNKRINIVVGNNGSGKSAILTALIIGLGGNAMATNRSKNIKQLIKHGESTATIQIDLDNDCKYSFESDKYGKKIIVIRTINQNGVSSYKLKNDRGTVVSTSKTELLKMTMYLNIQVENPVCILNQDAARSFLKNSNPQTNFKLFLKATQIEAIVNKLHACAKHYNAGKQQLDNQRKLIESLEKTVKETEHKYKKLQFQLTRKDELKELKYQQNWKLVIDQENFCNEIQKLIDESEQLMNKIKEKNKNQPKLAEKLQQQINELNNYFEKQQNQLNHLQIDKKSIEGDISKQFKLIEPLRQNIIRIEIKKNRYEHDIAEIKNDMANRIETPIATMKRLDKEKLIELSNKYKEIEAIITNATKDIEMMTVTRIQTDDKYHVASSQHKSLSLKADLISKKIKECSIRSDPLLVYGNYMPELIATIERMHKNGQFSELPRGPLGRYIQITDEKWRSTVEIIVSSVVKKLCVNTVADCKTLMNLIKTKFPMAKKLPICTVKFNHQVYDVSNGKVSQIPNTILAMDLIKTSDPIAMNMLIDYCQIESILLTENQELAERLTFDKKNVPKNLKRIILLHPWSEFYPDPNYRIYSLVKRSVRYIQVNIEEIKSQFNHHMKQVKMKQIAVNNELIAHKKKLVELNQTIREKRDILSRFHPELNSLKVDIKFLEIAKYPDELEEVVLLKELDELQGLLDSTLNDLKKANEELNEAINVEKNMETNLKDKINDIRNIKTELEQKRNEENSLRMNLSENANQISYNEKNIELIKKDMTDLNVEMNEATNKLVRLKGRAEKFGERIVTKFTHDELDDKIGKLKRNIDGFCTNENVEEIKQLLDARTKELTQIISQTNRLESVIKMLTKAIRLRYNNLIKLKQHMTLRVQHTFTNIMRLRNFLGQIKVNNDKQLMEISVIPHDIHLKTAISTANCLSGGERSYSTVAFLLALWSCVDFPFYVLDEYDVFTDQINRYYMTRLLISEAEKKADRQYIFLTPQDMSEVKPSEIISILKLDDPND